MPIDPNRENYLGMIEAQQLLGGRFSDIVRIDPSGGGGHFSLLFVATDNTTGQSVALKFYNYSDQSNFDPYRQASFEREAVILESLAGQKDIIGILAPLERYSELVTSGTGFSFPVPFAYYALELADGDARDMIMLDKWNTLEKLLAFRAMVRSIQRLHKSNIAHRDLKPQNYLVMSDKTVRLADFGTARSFNASVPALARDYIGPPGDMRYAAPEVLAILHDSEPRLAFTADFFALGAILFELFTGVILELQLFDIGYQEKLRSWMENVPSQKRKTVFGPLVKSMAANFRLPDISKFGTNVPSCLRDRLNELYQSLSSIDYRERLTDFDVIFRRLESCCKLVRNEEAYRRLQEVRRRRRNETRGLMVRSTT